MVDVYFSRLFACLVLSGCLMFLISCSPSGDLPPVEGELTDVVQDFTDKMVQEDFKGAYDYFDQPMRKALPLFQLKMIWRQLPKQAGSFVKSKGYQYETVQGYDVFNVALEFSEAFINMRVVFNEENRVTGLFFQPGKDPDAPTYQLPSYAQPALYTEEEILFGEKDWELPGTLTVPDGEGRFPAVVLVHGSGPNDRDETIGGNKPFKDLATGLANKGIVVLRYDKRTLVHNQKFALDESFTVNEETVLDAVYAIDFLAEHPKVDPHRIYIIGHSLGASLAPRIVQNQEKVAGCILLAAAARPLEDLVVIQTEYLAKADGTVSKEEENVIKELKKQQDNIKELKQSSKTPASQLMGVPASYWLDLNAYSPVQTAEDLFVPMLILQGERDYQVTMEDFELWKEGLRGKEHVTFKSYPALNHLFIAGEGESLPQEYELPKNVEVHVILDIADWVNGQ
ncbi:MAG TPA: hypothetical protein DDZ89_09255 [Clostridiales bacterium]|nr:hypothetical protein [Clostridiales bacterium]